MYLGLANKNKRSTRPYDPKNSFRTDNGWVSIKYEE